MKKNIFKILLIFIFFLLIISISKNVEANSINRISMDIFIDNNGNAQVTEIWDCNATEGTEVYHPYYNLGTSEITNLTVSENGSVYETLYSWNTSNSFNNKAYRCGINQIKNGVELCWGISKYGNHTYTVKYNISNFVSSLEDSQMLYWTLIPHSFSNPIGSVYIKIHTNFHIASNTDVWGYGNYGGTAYVYDGYIEMQSDGRLEANEYMTILVKFEKGTFNTLNYISEDFEHYYEMAQEGSVAYNGSSSNSKTYKFISSIAEFFAILASFVPAIIIIIIASLTGNKGSLNFGPEGKKFSKDTPYFRDIPCNKDIFRAYYIAYEYGLISKKTDLLGSIILKWVSENIVQMDKKEGGVFIKKENDIIILNNTDTSLIKDTYELQLFNMLYEASKDGILEGKEFEKWCKNHYSKILSWFDNIIENQKNKLVSEGLITMEEKKTLGIFKSKVYTATPMLREEAEKIYGLKKFLLDYTLISDRQAPEVHLLEEYLIIAQMLGIAKEVAKEFKELYPDVIAQSSFDSYDTIIFINMYSNRGVSAATTAKSRAESYSSGGGGFSSGGGGGGSFGGGGGGGGFR